MNRLLTVQEVAERLQVKVSWVYANAEGIGGYRLGKYWRFSWDRVIARLERDGQSLGSATNDLLQEIDEKEFPKGREQNGNRFVDPIR